MTIAALMVLSFMWCGYWLLCRSVRSSQATTTAAAPEQHITHEATSLGLEDNPNQWHPGRSGWTALDDLQLTRLLVDSTSTTGEVANSTDTDSPG